MANTTRSPKRAPAKKAGACDWRVVSQYPDEEKLRKEWESQGYYPDERTLLSMWRWEFLRRRADYRTAYAEQNARSQAYWDELFATDGAAARWQKRADFDHLGARHLSSIADDFGLEFVPSPKWNFCIQPGGLFRKSYGWGYSSFFAKEIDRFGRKKVDARISDDQMLIAFDVTLPLSDQLRRASEHLEALQTERYGAPIKSARHHRRKWVQYLRAIDAREEDQTFESIWQNIGLDGVSAQDFDASADTQNWAASGRQLWQQAVDLMNKLAAKT